VYFFLSREYDSIIGYYSVIIIIIIIVITGFFVFNGFFNFLLVQHGKNWVCIIVVLEDE